MNYKLTVLVLFLVLNGRAQTYKGIKKAKQLFEGSWINKKTNRHLLIVFDGRDHYANINDWTGNDRSSADAYKAWVKNNKLIMPKENDDHRAPYCEILISRKRLLFRCKGLIKNEGQFIDSTYFVRSTL